MRCTSLLVFFVAVTGCFFHPSELAAAVRRPGAALAAPGNASLLLSEAVSFQAPIEGESSAEVAARAPGQGAAFPASGNASLLLSEAVSFLAPIEWESWAEVAARAPGMDIARNAYIIWRIVGAFLSRSPDLVAGVPIHDDADIWRLDTSEMPDVLPPAVELWLTMWCAVDVMNCVGNADLSGIREQVGCLCSGASAGMSLFANDYLDVSSVENVRDEEIIALAQNLRAKRSAAIINGAVGFLAGVAVELGNGGSRVDTSLIIRAASFIAFAADKIFSVDDDCLVVFQTLCAAARAVIAAGAGKMDYVGFYLGQIRPVAVPLVSSTLGHMDVLRLVYRDDGRRLRDAELCLQEAIATASASMERAYRLALPTALDGDLARLTDVSVDAFSVHDADWMGAHAASRARRAGAIWASADAAARASTDAAAFLPVVFSLSRTVDSACASAEAYPRTAPVFSSLFNADDFVGSLASVPASSLEATVDVILAAAWFVLRASDQALNIAVAAGDDVTASAARRVLAGAVEVSLAARNEDWLRLKEATRVVVADGVAFADLMAANEAAAQKAAARASAAARCEVF
jgi:hypothetical protein